MEEQPKELEQPKGEQPRSKGKSVLSFPFQALAQSVLAGKEWNPEIIEPKDPEYEHPTFAADFQVLEDEVMGEFRKLDTAHCTARISFGWSRLS